MKTTSLSISIVNYNTEGLLRNCLQTLFQYTTDIDFEVFVVDNASRDNSIKMVEEFFPQVELIKKKKNIGFAAANNLALKRANGKYFLLLNSDTELIDNSLKVLVDFMEEATNCGICCPQLIYPDGSLQKSYSNFHTAKQRAGWEYFPQLRKLKQLLFKNKTKSKQPNNKVKYPKIVTEISRPRGACFFVRMETIKEVGMLDERFFLYAEEVDWALRIKKARWKNYFVPQSKVIHVWGASTNKKELLFDDIHTQSDYKYYYKHFGLKGFLLVWSGHLFGALLSLIIGCMKLFIKRDISEDNHFQIAFQKIRKLFLIKDIRPSE